MKHTTIKKINKFFWIFVLIFSLLPLLWILNIFKSSERKIDKNYFKYWTIYAHNEISKNININNTFYISDTLLLLDYFLDDLTNINGKWYSNNLFQTIYLEKNENLFSENLITTNSDSYIIKNKLIIIDNTNAIVNNTNFNMDLYIENSIIIANNDYYLTSRNNSNLYIKNSIVSLNLLFFQNYYIYNSSANLTTSQITKNSQFNNNFELVVMDTENKVNLENGFYDEIWSYLTVI